MIEKFTLITASFLRDHNIKLSWSQILCGLDKGLISAKEITIYALNIVEEDTKAIPEIILLAGITKEELFKVRELVEKLAEFENIQNKGNAEDTWLYIVLLWLYEHRNVIEDPLGKVEIVYADFNYPASISSFVRYMPSEESNQYSKTGESYLYEQWKKFLESTLINQSF